MRGLYTPASMAPVEHVVADAGAFLRDAPLQDIGKNIYTIREVVREIRDKATRRRLAVLPYELRFKEPFPEYVRLDRVSLCSFRAYTGTRSGDQAGLELAEIRLPLPPAECWD